MDIIFIVFNVRHICKFLSNAINNEICRTLEYQPGNSSIDTDSKMAGRSLNKTIVSCSEDLTSSARGSHEMETVI